MIVSLALLIIVGAFTLAMMRRCRWCGSYDTAHYAIRTRVCRKCGRLF